ncbi:MAG: hypothetical protein R3F13_17910 [Prosthecobacter sp.]
MNQHKTRLLLLSPAVLTLLVGCSYETRDLWWKKLDPAGYKHTHSEVFNPHGYQRYQRATPPDSLPPIDDAEAVLPP